MSIRIGANLTNLFNQSRINQAPEIEKPSELGKARQTQIADDREQQSNSGQYISQEHGGVIQTRVADTNSFKKAQLDGSRANIESMADRLYSKLPNILADMKLVPGEEEKAGNVSRVSVTERNAAAVAEKQVAQEPQQLTDFSL